MLESRVVKEHVEEKLMSLQKIDQTLTAANFMDEIYHTECVAGMMKLLAPAYGIDADLAYCAGWLHDYARVSGLDTERSHAAAGALYAAQYLTDQGFFTVNQIEQLSLAIHHHSKKNKQHDQFSEMLKAVDLYHRLLQGDWDITPKNVQRVTKINKFWSSSMAQQIHMTLAELYRHRIQLAIDDWQLYPQEPENIHKIRVALRHFEALLTLYKEHLIKENHGRWQTCIKKALKACGKIRNIDLTLQFLKDLSSRSTDDVSLSDIQQNQLTALTAFLEVNRQQALSQLTFDGVTEPIRFKNLSNIKKSKYPTLKDYRHHEEKLSQKSSKLITTIQHSGYSENNHQNRIKLKQLRYQLVVMNHFVRPSSPKLLDTIKQVQEQTGKIQDCQAIAKQLKRSMKDNPESFDSMFMNRILQLLVQEQMALQNF